MTRYIPELWKGGCESAETQELKMTLRVVESQFKAQGGSKKDLPNQITEAALRAMGPDVVSAYFITEIARYREGIEKLTVKTT